MNEDKKTIYCIQCGSENPESAKFCSNCGAKLEQPAKPQAEGVFSGGDTLSAQTPVYEKITDAEEERPANPYQEEIKINYGPDNNHYGNNDYSSNYGNYNGGSDYGTSGANTYYDGGQTQYYSAESDTVKEGGGNIGFAIASLVCGILSLLCCCLDLFSPILAIAAIVLGVITLCFKYDGRGMAIAGISTGGVALVFRIIILIIAFATGFSTGTSAYGEFMRGFMDEFY